MRFTLLLCVLALWTAHASAQSATLVAGVALDLATARAGNVSDLHYDLALRVPKTVTDPISGTAIVRFTLKSATAPLVLDFETSRNHVKRVEANGKATTFDYVNGHIVVPASALVAGDNALTIAFDAGNDSLNRSADFLYALFVPARARLAIPCFDQPDLKARWTLTLTFPSGWKAVSNGAEVRESVTISDGPGGAGNATTIAFAETEPLSTYLFSFAVGDFKVETAEREGRAMRMFHRETDAAKVARNRDVIFDLHARAIAFMEQYTGIPYAFGKFDFVLIPAFQFGGMEHAGEVLYNASGLLLDESATQNQHLGRASAISHETAHMWFGDLVTMKWFDDVWMKEVFANFMAGKIVNPSFPEVNHDLRFLLSNYPAAYEVDRTAGANPIKQVLDNLNEAGSMYGAIIYQKAPIVMRHLEALMGEDNFRDGLREYLKAHAFGNATWADLIAVLDRRTPQDLQAWSKAWVEQPGRPTIETKLEVENGKVQKLAFEQRDLAGLGRVWPQELRVETRGAGQSGSAAAIQPDQLYTPVLAGRAVDVAAATGHEAPAFVLPSAQGWAYGDFVLDARSLDYLSRSLPDLPTALQRGSAWVTLWDTLLGQRLTPTAFIDLATKAVGREDDEQLKARVLGYAGNTWWRFLSAAERTRRAPAFEAVLREELAAASTASRKATVFGALRNVALTPETGAWLKRVWEKTETVPGLTLAEADYTTLSLELAVREVDGWSEVLQTQLGRIENPDRKGRFQFVMPALSSDPAERDRWFQSLKDVNNRRKEPWVLEGLNYLHHPLRARASAHYVSATLDMLWEIQKTGDIFFPKRWLDATLGGHSSPEVASMVRAFLKGLPPNYPARLRNITLQSADELFRAAAIVK